MNRKFYAWVLVSLCLLGACSPRLEYQYAEGKIYGTYYHISYEASQNMNEELWQEMNRINASLSMFNRSSVISRINNNESDSVDYLFCRMFDLAKKVNQVSGGLYDITVAPLVNAWGFGFKKESFPDSARIDSLRLLVGMDKIALKEGRLIKQLPGLQMDASSIAKGLGVDLAAEYLEAKGVVNYMVEIGGEVRVKGNSNKKRAWRIGIDRPEDDVTAQSRELQMVLELNSGALATSGNYRNFYIREGKKYAHTISPLTGYPIQTEVLGASVYAPSCMEADAYATAFMVMGLQNAKQVIMADSDLEGCLIYEENGVLKTWVSEGLKKRILSEEEK